MSKARDIADLGSVTTRLDEVGNTDGALSNRNLIINGAMQVAQRGTSVTGIGSNAGGPFTCDRFQHAQGSTGGSGVMTMEQSTDGPDGFSSSLKLTVTTADTLSGGENVGIRHRIEGQNVQHLKFGSSSAESVTLSFWVKASLTGTYSAQAHSAGGNRTALEDYTVSSANTWEYKEITFVGDTGTAIANDNTRGFELFFSLDAGPDDIVDTYTWSDTAAFRAATGQVNFMATNGATWQITGVQLELGKVATPFDHPRSYAEELAACQRYYLRLDDDGSRMATGFISSSTRMDAAFSFPVTMRVAPTALETSGDATDYTIANLSGSIVCTQIPLYQSASKNTAMVTFIATGLTAGAGSYRGLSDGFFAWSAEL